MSLLLRLERLRIFVQNRNATVGSPEEGNSCGPQRGPAVPSSSFQEKEQSASVCKREPVTQDAEGPSKMPSRIWGFSFCRGNRDAAFGDGEKVRMLWDCCRNCKISPHGSKPPEGRLPLPPPPQQGSKPDRLGVHGRTACQSAALSIITTTDSAAFSETGASTVDTLDSATPSIPSIDSGHDSLMDVEIILNTMQRAHSGDKVVFDNSEESIGFLRAISASCMEALQSGKDTLELPYTKAELAEVLVMVMETLPSYSVPSGTLSYSMVTVYNLSKIKPPLDSELESCILRLALHGIFSMDVDQEDSHSQALYKSSSDTMETMLKGLLSEVPTTSHLLFILRHLNFWIHSPDVQERTRAVRCSTVLLQYAVQLPDFEKTGELPALGHQVAQYGICITDSLEDVSHQAREAIECLYQLLLRHVGLNTREGGELWCQLSEERKLRAYLDTCRVGEAEDMEREIYEELFRLRTLRQVPEALQSIIPRKVDHDA
ncbi:hypothetical protein JRQ81_013314 [Phrynocephalus forsythii]|uniref:Uncharacterized protein n=1 Tax=Phrynocephalus forsythii TaxID=171643 RepID=A0A9Q1B3X5_9SAUR|nr:hypothetical protein JRQ81_013314 [Phrynocephalus forsythii]